MRFEIERLELCKLMDSLPAFAVLQFVVGLDFFHTYLKKVLKSWNFTMPSDKNCLYIPIECKEN